MPAQLKALAYTQGNQVYMGAGQNKYLPHEFLHVAQQKQGSVQEVITLAPGMLNAVKDPGVDRIIEDYVHQENKQENKHTA